MLIELLIVSVILSYLYGAGFLEVGDPKSLAIAIAIVLGGLAVGGIITKWFAGHLVDGLLGFGGGGAPKPKDPRRRDVPAWTADPIPVLEKMVRQLPADAESSRRLAEAYLAAGDLDSFVAEKSRILAAGRLSREEIVSTLHRIADAQLDLDQESVAVDTMHEIIRRFPGGQEALLAEKRIEIIEDRIRERAARTP